MEVFKQKDSLWHLLHGRFLKNELLWGESRGTHFLNHADSLFVNHTSPKICLNHITAKWFIAPPCHNSFVGRSPSSRMGNSIPKKAKPNVATTPSKPTKPSKSTPFPSESVEYFNCPWVLTKDHSIAVLVEENTADWKFTLLGKLWAKPSYRNKYKCTSSTGAMRTVEALLFQCNSEPHKLVVLKRSMCGYEPPNTASEYQQVAVHPWCQAASSQGVTLKSWTGIIIINAHSFSFLFCRPSRKKFSTLLLLIGRCSGNWNLKE